MVRDLSPSRRRQRTNWLLTRGIPWWAPYSPWYTTRVRTAVEALILAWTLISVCTYARGICIEIAINVLRRSVTLTTSALFGPGVQCVWAIWQLYHYVDLFPQWVHFTITRVKDLVDDEFDSLVTRIDSALEDFTERYLLQYRV
jgi:hypothetical protein